LVVSSEIARLAAAGDRLLQLRRVQPRSPATLHFTTVVIGEAIARMMMRKTGVSNDAAAMAF